MHLQLALLVLLLGAAPARARDDASVRELFRKYDQVMDEKKVELIDDVFSSRFLKESGGRTELVEKIRELASPPAKRETAVTWRKGTKGEIYFARPRDAGEKAKAPESGSSEFVIVNEDGKLKIDGTMSDGE
jgi:hypothetical protein